MQPRRFPRVLLLLFLAWPTSGGCGRPPRERSAARQPEAKAAAPAALPRELIEMGRLDQAVRAGMSPASLQDSAFMFRMMRTDSLHTARLEQIVAAYGWPSAARVGAEAARAAFLMLQHSPSHELQKRLLPEVEAAAKHKEVPPQEVALLSDRVRKHEGVPQRYGTQFDMIGGKLVMYAVEDEAHLDERRAALGLPPMAEYVKALAEAYRAPVVAKP